MNPSPGFRKYPQHHIETRPSSVHVRVTCEGEVIAETREAVELQEDTGEGKKTVAPVVYYIPRKDDTPYDEMLAIKGRLAFYPDKFQISVS